MKKRVLFVAILALAAVMGVVLCGCNETGQQTAIEILRDQYANIANAQTIDQKIEIKKGALVQFESNKTYNKTESGYTVTGTEKKLNDLDADKPFDEKIVNESVQSVADGVPTLKLDEAYFADGYRLTETGLTATVKQDNIKDVFGITGETEAPTDNLVLELSVSGGQLSVVRINYDSGESHVEITLTMAY